MCGGWLVGVVVGSGASGGLLLVEQLGLRLDLLGIEVFAFVFGAMDIGDMFEVCTFL